MTSRVVIGVGNPDRGDDDAGRAVAARLRGSVHDGVAVMEHAGEATSLLELMERADACWLVDAASSGAPAGTIRRFDVAAAPLPHTLLALSSHGFGVGEAVELARALGSLPRRCVVFAIEGAGFEAGAPLSQAVAQAVEAVAARIVRELQEVP
ncbi:MAG: hydrogenase maturation protease [Alphaproteobacteria bacterium]|nr:hydrogenase maturation protease [Alphaproteobacteria bacterium]